MPIFFETPGVIDLRSITLMGVSAKPNSDSPIGYFGTGLKYAIATIYRLGGRVVIHTEGRRIHFEVRDDEFRGQAFKSLWMCDAGSAERLPFSLDYGKNWEAWMAFRELESNTRDEGGRSWQGGYFDEPTVPTPNTTLMEVRGAEIDAVWSTRNSIFLASKPIWASDRLEVHPRQPGDHFYYRGVRVGKASRTPHYTYNILNNARLTEDRTLNIYTAMAEIGLSLTYCTDPAICRKVVRPGRDHWESDIDLNWSTDPSQEFLAAIEEIGGDYSEAVNTSARKKANSLGLKNLNIPPTAEQERIIQRGLDLFNQIFEDNWPRSYVALRPLGQGILGLADGGTIVLAPSALERGMFDLVATILEEHLHITTGHFDYTRDMQDYLFRKWLGLAAAKAGVVL
jgi:hypothetical protein